MVTVASLLHLGPRDVPERLPVGRTDSGQEPGTGRARGPGGLPGAGARPAVHLGRPGGAWTCPGLAKRITRERQGWKAGFGPRALHCRDAPGCVSPELREPRTAVQVPLPGVLPALDPQRGPARPWTVPPRPGTRLAPVRAYGAGSAAEATGCEPGRGGAAHARGPSEPVGGPCAAAHRRPPPARTPASRPPLPGPDAPPALPGRDVTARGITGLVVCAPAPPCPAAAASPRSGVGLEGPGTPDGGP